MPLARSTRLCVDAPPSDARHEHAITSTSTHSAVLQAYTTHEQTGSHAFLHRGTANPMRRMQHRQQPLRQISRCWAGHVQHLASMHAMQAPRPSGRHVQCRSAQLFQTGAASTSPQADVQYIERTAAIGRAQVAGVEAASACAGVNAGRGGHERRAARAPQAIRCTGKGGLAAIREGGRSPAGGIDKVQPNSRSRRRAPHTCSPQTLPPLPSRPQPGMRPVARSPSQSPVTTAGSAARCSR